MFVNIFPQLYFTNFTCFKLFYPHIGRPLFSLAANTSHTSSQWCGRSMTWCFKLTTCVCARCNVRSAPTSAKTGLRRRRVPMRRPPCASVVSDVTRFRTQVRCPIWAGPHPAKHHLIAWETPSWWTVITTLLTEKILNTIVYKYFNLWIFQVFLLNETVRKDKPKKKIRLFKRTKKRRI